MPFARSTLVVVTLAAAILLTGCTGSRWAKRDPKYARKYSHHTDDPAKVVKQAIDARQVGGRSGWYFGGAGGDNPFAGDLSLGKFLYPEPSAGTLEVRGGVRGLAVESGGWAAGGELGARLQAPTRLAPFVGVSGFLGAAPEDYLNATNETSFPDDEETTTTFAGGLSPEIGVHFWLTPAWRLTASATQTYIDFEGPTSGDYTTVGLTLAYLDVPGLRSPRKKPSPTCTTVTAAPSPLPVLPASTDEPTPGNPYAQILATPSSDTSTESD